MIPWQVLGLIGDTPAAVLPGITTENQVCQGAKFHSPRPMIVHPFKINRLHEVEEVVYLCGTCADNVKVLLALLEARGGDVPWTVRRCFGNLARSVAAQAYTNR